MESVFEWISLYGYAALFVLLVLGIIGLPVPDETLLVFCGYLVAQGKLAVVGTYAAAAAGSLCGITISYWIGRGLGFEVVHWFGRYARVGEQRLDQIHRWFNRSGHWLLFVGYYIAGVRHFTALIAGASHLEFRSFMLYAWSGGAIWVGAFLTIGYVIGENWREIADLVHRWMHWIAYGFVAAAIVYWLIWRARKPVKP
jgi:membrane protein DedA with SNARE-associated domain